MKIHKIGLVWCGTLISTDRVSNETNFIDFRQKLWILEPFYEKKCMILSYGLCDFCLYVVFFDGAIFLNTRGPAF